ncbi:MAG: M48 family metallopeptidase [Bacillota bacterium]
MAGHTKKDRCQKSGQIRLGGRLVSYSVRYSKKSKRPALKIDIDSGLEVILPEGSGKANPDHLIKSRESWVLAGLARVDLLKEKIKQRGLEENSVVLYLGREYRMVRIIRNDVSPYVKFDDDRFFVTVPDDTPEKTAAVLEKWYRSQAEKIFNERARAIGAKMNLKYNRIFIRSQQTRWGSCSRLRNLSFNWRLVMAPVQVIDYLIVHEMAHTEEMNHSANFWRLVERACPDYRAHRKWLKDQGPVLTL